MDCQIIMLAFLDGRFAEVDFALLLQKRISFHGSTLRNRSQAFKRQLRDEFVAKFYDEIANQQFGGPTGAPLNPGAQQQLERMYPGLKIPENTRQPAMALGESAFSPEALGGYGSAPASPTLQQDPRQSFLSPGSLQPPSPQAMPNPLRQTATPPSQMMRQPGSPYDVYRQQNPYFDPNNPFNNRLMSGRGF